MANSLKHKVVVVTCRTVIKYCCTVIKFRRTVCYEGGKLASLEEFRIQREELMSQTAKLEAMLQEQANAHQEDIYNLEKKQVIDKDK